MKYFACFALTLSLVASADSYVQIYCPKPIAINSDNCNNKSGDQKEYNYSEVKAHLTERFTSPNCVPNTSKLKNFKAASLTPVEGGYYINCEYDSSDKSSVYLGTKIASNACDLNGNPAYYHCAQSDPKNCRTVCRIQ